PGFVNFSYGNTNPQQFQLTSSSICKDVGESNITFTMHPDNDPAALNYLGSGENIVNYYLKRDWNGRLRDSQWDVGAFEYVGNQVIQDNDPPEVVSAIIVDSITVNVTFSEPMDQSSVTNPTNYSIDNGIVVNSVQSLSPQSVRLNTSVHSPGFYTLTVNSVTDTAGNIISAQQNSFLYGYNPDPLLELKFIPNNSLASAISDTPYVPQKTFDGLTYSSGDPTTRWAASGLPQWIVYDLGDAKMLNKTRIQYYNWNQGRIYNYSIQVSTDSVNWTYVKQNVSSTNTEWTEEVFDPTPARYVKIIVHSNNQNNWASLWEAEFYGNLIISGNDDLTNVPKEFKLEQNYPNPFNPTTKIRYSIPSSTEYYSVLQKVTLKVYDILGNEIATLVDDYKSAGNYEVDFNASDIASGVYIYRLFVQDLQSNDGKNGVYTESKKMLLMR
ncbi:MAG: discoidin domain-containing protein, partial [Ignavibacterium sp.]